MNDDLIFLHCNHMSRCTAVIDKHFDGYWTLQLVSRGAVELFYEDERHEMEPYTVWPCFPGPRIRFHSGDGRAWEHRHVAFKGPRVAVWESQGLWVRRPQRVTASPRAFVRAFDRLIGYARRNDRLGRLRAVNLLEELLLELTEQRAPTLEERPQWLRDVLASLADLSMEEPDYEALARAHNMSLTTLRRRFREETGVALHTYRLQCRVAAARTLLGDTDLPIKEVADQLGYRDVFYFTRQFTKAVGLAPAAYRKSRQG